jgi:hypothetical protein
MGVHIRGIEKRGIEAVLAHPLKVSATGLNSRYVGEAKEFSAASFRWAGLKSQIDPGRPLALTVGANGDGNTDRLVTVVGATGRLPTQDYMHSTAHGKTHVERKSPDQAEGRLLWGLQWIPVQHQPDSGSGNV